MMNLYFTSQKKDTLLVLFVLSIYTFIFLPVVFSQVISTEFMKEDPQSIVLSLKGLTTSPYYNMNAQYHSQFYGWTYFSVNFFILMIGKIFGLNDEVTINILIKSVHYIIGALLILSIYKTSRRFFDPLISAFLAFTFMVCPVTTFFLMTIHPETLGLLFQLLGILFLIKLYDCEFFCWKKLYIAVALFSLSGLCKQSFLIVSIFIAISFFVSYYFCKENGRYFFTKGNILKLVSLSSIIFLTIAFIIHPYAFIEFERFYYAQSSIKNEHAAVAFSEVLTPWLHEISLNLLMIFNFLILFTLFFKKKNHLPYKLSVLLSCIVSIVLIFNARKFITSSYLFPLYAIFIFNTFYFLYYFIEPLCRSKMRSIFYAIISVVLLLSFSNGISSLDQCHSKYLLDGKDTTVNSWNYIKQLDKETKIAYSPTIAVPQPHKAIGCSAWQGCGDYQSLHKYNPDFIIIVPTYKYFNIEEYLKYINDNNYSLVKEYSHEKYAALENCNGVNTKTFLIPESYMSQFSSCYEKYKTMIKLYRTQEIVTGDSISIYQKVKAI